MTKRYYSQKVTFCLSCPNCIDYLYPNMWCVRCKKEITNVRIIPEWCDLPEYNGDLKVGLP